MSAARSYRPPPPEALEILFKDDALLAVNKPAGLLTVPGRGENKRDCLLSRLHQDHPEALVVHRLDMETSGIVLFARNADMQSRLGRLFANRSIGKRYIAVVSGHVVNQSGDINLPLSADWPNRPRQKIDTERGKSSHTRYRVLEYMAISDTTRVELIPITGRSHQLRVHMMSLGHPITGDRLYGNEANPGSRLMLHAEQIELPHPASDSSICIRCKSPF